MKIYVLPPDHSEGFGVDWPAGWRVPAKHEILEIGSRVYRVLQVVWRHPSTGSEPAVDLMVVRQ